MPFEGGAKYRFPVRKELMEMAKGLGVERRLAEALSQITKDKVTSESTIGRVLSYLKQRHPIKEHS
jgi:hypothetical protein